MDDPILVKLSEDAKINIVAVVEIDLGSDNLHYSYDKTTRTSIRGKCEYGIEQILAQMNLMSAIKKLQVIQKENGVFSPMLTDANTERTIFLLPSIEGGQKVEKQIVVKLRHEMMPKSLYLGLNYNDLYLRWFLGEEYRYVFSDGIVSGDNTKQLEYSSSYVDMLGVGKFGDISLNVGKFTTSLLDLYKPRSLEPDRTNVATVILYFVEALRFRCLRARGFLFQLVAELDETGQGHAWQKYLSKIVNDWGPYSKRLFKEDGDGGFYTTNEFCQVVQVLNRTTLYKILNVALNSDEAMKWEIFISKVKGSGTGESSKRKQKK